MKVELSQIMQTGFRASFHEKHTGKKNCFGKPKRNFSEKRLSMVLRANFFNKKC